MSDRKKLSEWDWVAILSMLFILIALVGFIMSVVNLFAATYTSESAFMKANLKHYDLLVDEKGRVYAMKGTTTIIYADNSTAIITD